MLCWLVLFHLHTSYSHLGRRNFHWEKAPTRLADRQACSTFLMSTPASSTVHGLCISSCLPGSLSGGLLWNCKLKWTLPLWVAFSHDFHHSNGNHNYSMTLSKNSNISCCLSPPSSWPLHPSLSNTSLKQGLTHNLDQAGLELRAISWLSLSSFETSCKSL